MRKKPLEKGIIHWGKFMDDIPLSVKKKTSFTPKKAVAGLRSLYFSVSSKVFRLMIPDSKNGKFSRGIIQKEKVDCRRQCVGFYKGFGNFFFGRFWTLDGFGLRRMQ